MSKSSPHFSIHEVPKSLRVWKQPKTTAFLISGGVVTKVEKAVRESDFTLSSQNVRRSEGVNASWRGRGPSGSLLNDDSVWSGMIKELATSGCVLPKSLESVSEQVSAVLEKPVSVISDQKFAKLAKEAERLAASAEKEAKRAEKRRQNKIAKTERPIAQDVIKKHPVVLSLEKRLARIAKSMDVYRYLDPTVSEDVPRPSADDVADFLSVIEKAVYEIALEYGRKGVNMLAKLSELLDLVVRTFPEASDVRTPIRDSFLKTPSKPIRQAENRV